jgi:hypothetical protein
MDRTQITNLAYRLLLRHQEISKEQELTPETIEKIAERIQRIQAGLAPEMEFMAAINWLGRVVSVQRLDQTPLPRYVESGDIEVPDLIAIVQIDGKTFPVLIEVKTKSDKKLVWTESYLQGLKRYAKILQMPLCSGLEALEHLGAV